MRSTTLAYASGLRSASNDSNSSGVGGTNPDVGAGGVSIVGPGSEAAPDWLSFAAGNRQRGHKPAGELAGISASHCGNRRGSLMAGFRVRSDSADL